MESLPLMGFNENITNLNNIFSVDSLNLYYDILYPISNLSGIECFTDLKYFYCKENQQTSLDVSNNAELTGTSCVKNVLRKIKPITQIMHM